MFRAGLHLDAGAYASYGLNTAPQSPSGSKRVDVKGETSHLTLNILITSDDNNSTSKEKRTNNKRSFL